MLVNIYKHMATDMIKILQGRAVTQTVLGGLGLTIYSPVASFVWCTCAPKIMKVGWQYRQDYCNNNQAYFFLAHPVSLSQ